MDYKLLRALSIFLQAGLVILLIMLLSLVLVSCTSTAAKKATVKLQTESHKGIMEQRFFNEVRQQRQHFKVLCNTKQLINTKQLSNRKDISYESTSKKA